LIQPSKHATQSVTYTRACVGLQAVKYAKKVNPNYINSY